MTERTNEDRRWPVIYADPPWDIEQKGARGAISKYPVMTLDAIKAMPVSDLAADNATLLLWTTSAALPGALEVMKAWGFRFRTTAVWDKYYMGLGNYFRGSHELLLHGTRGKAPFRFHGQRSVLIFPRTEHSRKPDEMIPLIERVLEGPYLELFARRRPHCASDSASRSHWSVWGNEVESDVIIPGYPVPAYSERAVLRRSDLEKGA